MESRMPNQVLTDGNESGNSSTTFPRGFSAHTKFAWPLVRASSLVTLNYGKALVEKNRTAGSVPVYGTNGQCGTHNEALADGQTVILGRKGMGPLGVEWCDGPFWVIDTAYYVTPNTPRLDLKYFYYLVHYIGLNHLKDGTSNPSLSRDTFNAQLLPIPDPADQKAIAGVLSAFDDKIELNRRMNQTLEQMAQALFRSWFVDFDPVRAKMAGRQPAGMDAETAALFPDTLEDSTLGPIPQSWKVEALSTQIHILSGGTPKTSEAHYWDGDIPWVSVVDTTPGPYIISTEKTITQAGLENSATKLLPSETVVITARGTVGNCAMMAKPMTMNQSCYGLRGRGAVGQIYLLQLVLDAVDRLKANAHGSVFDTITRATFDGIQTIVSTDNIMQAWEQNARRIFDVIKTNLYQMQILASTRDALLPKLLSGEVRVADAQNVE